MGEVSEVPYSAEQTALARIVPVHRLAHVLGICLRCCSVGIKPHAYGARTNGKWLVGDKRTSAFGHGRQSFEAFGYRSIVTGVNQRRIGEVHEIGKLGGGPLAVELGEITHHAAANPR